MRILRLALPLVVLACDHEPPRPEFDSSFEAVALIALASDTATRFPSSDVVCFGVTRTNALGGRGPSEATWQRIRQAFPRARSVESCNSRDTVEVWGLVLLDSAERRDGGDVVAWGTQVGEHANRWRCLLRHEQKAWVAKPCEWYDRAPQDRPSERPPL